MKNINTPNRSGQMLVTLVVFIVVALTIAATSVSIIMTNSLNTQSTGQSLQAYYAAEAGIENATLQLLRNPGYGGEVLVIDTGVVAEIVVTENGQYIITSTGKSGIYTRKIQAILDYTNNVLSVISWEELF